MGHRSALMECAANQLRGADRVWLGTHVDPDGDAIGSLLGLGWALRALGKSVTEACADPCPPETLFLPGRDRISRDGIGGHDLAIALDAADEGRLGRLYDADAWQGVPTLVVDHHVSNPGFGDLNLIDPVAASTAEIVADLLAAMGVTPGPEAATCLLTGIVTDTLGFRTTNTTAQTLACAGRMMNCGASLPEISQQVFYRRPLAALRLTGRVLDQLEVHGPFALALLRRSDLDAVGAAPGASRGITAMLATAAEPAVVALLRERSDGGIDISLRAKPGTDVVPAAQSLGGGGHPAAAGARLDGPIEDARQTVLEALQRHCAGPGTADAPPDGDGA